LAQQIAALKLSLSQGQGMQNGGLGTQGVASSGWGQGTSPYAVAPAEAPDQSKVENRQDGTTRDGTTSDFEPLYAPEDFAHGGRDEQVHGKIDFSKAPQKIEEIRSAPETQQALAEYSGAISAYTEGEENAIQREQVPVEYQEMVRAYFDELKKDAKAKDKKAKPTEKPKAKAEK